jgi:hypothetical protein
MAACGAPELSFGASADGLGLAFQLGGRPGPGRDGLLDAGSGSLVTARARRGPEVCQSRKNMASSPTRPSALPYSWRIWARSLSPQDRDPAAGDGIIDAAAAGKRHRRGVADLVLHRGDHGDPAADQRRGGAGEQGHRPRPRRRSRSSAPPAEASAGPGAAGRPAGAPRPGRCGRPRAPGPARPRPARGRNPRARNRHQEQRPRATFRTTTNGCDLRISPDPSNRQPRKRTERPHPRQSTHARLDPRVMADLPLASCAA